MTAQRQNLSFDEHQLLINPIMNKLSLIFFSSLNQAYGIYLSHAGISLEVTICLWKVNVPVGTENKSNNKNF